jgi:hypothetical protein
MAGNRCVTRLFCGCLGKPGCSYHDPNSDNVCLFYNEYKGWCCNPAAINDELVRKGFIQPERGKD